MDNKLWSINLDRFLKKIKYLDCSFCTTHPSSLKILKNKNIFFIPNPVDDSFENLDHFKNKISSLTTIDIPNQPNSINGEELMKKLKNSKNINYKKSIIEAIKSIDLKENDIILITGSLYLAGEVLNQN